MIFIEYPKGSTCQKAKKWLEDKKIKFEDRNIITQTPTVDEIKSWIKLSNKDINKWFNTTGIRYRELNLKEKLSSMTDEEKINLLASDGMLIKRPLLIAIDFVLNGFKVKEWEDTIK